MHLAGSGMHQILESLRNLRRVDHIHVDTAWDRLKEIAAEEGIAAIGYERKYGEYRYKFLEVCL